MFIVMHDRTLGPRAVPDGRGGVLVVEPGVPFDVDDAIAGESAGPWETCEGDVPRAADGQDLADGYAYEPLGKPVEVDTDGDGDVDVVLHYFRRRHLGSGLLAQYDVFRPATDDEAARAGDLS